MADFTQPIADQIRARLSGGRPVCEALCAAPAWEVEGRTVLRWPLGASGSTGGGLVPLGPAFLLELASDGVALRCGEEPAVAACPGVPPIDAGRVGFWVDRSSVDELMTDAQRARALWLRDDGTSLRLEPGWSVAFGRWHAETGDVVLDESLTVSARGGGMVDDHVLGVLCAPRALHVRTVVAGATLETWQRTEAPQIDEAFFRRGCTP